ncbi:MAG: hypothetical protein ACOCQQ_02555 [Candidatus Nanoarchaeia archaeon]
MKTWYKKLGYAYNPFTIKPGFFDDEVVGYDKEIETLVFWLKNEKLCFLQAEYGLGKSTILKYLVNELKEDFKIAYISRNRSDRSFDYEKLLIGANKGLGKLFGKKAKKVILIVDETEKLNEKDCEHIDNLFSAGYFHSVLFMDASFAKTGFSSEVKKKIGKNILKLSPLSIENALNLVYSRLERKDLISKELVEKIFLYSNKNTRFFLLNLEDVFAYAIRAGKKAITQEDVDAVLK